MSSTDEGSHAADQAYSKVRRTREMYAALFTYLVHSLRLCLKKPSVFDAFAVVAMWRLYGYARIDRCSHSRRDTSHCPLPPVYVCGACSLTVSQSVCWY